jgi:hypothetical protein
MGVSIHYSGQLKEAALLPLFIEEVEDIAKILGWKYNTFLKEYTNNLFETTISDNDYGIMVTPLECEPVVFIFDYEGHLYSPWLKQYFTDRFYIYNISTKTQFAGADTHIKVIELMKHLNKKYFNNFTMIDEGEYWETGDSAIVESKISFLGDKIKQLTIGLKNTKMKDGETMEDFIKRIAEGLE